MQTRVERGLLPVPPTVRLSQSCEREICGQQHLLILPLRTRPNLFGD
ncbi:MAG: hypothetical protein ACLGPM_06505 [Acidobacteriota bacterium]